MASADDAWAICVTLAGELWARREGGFADEERVDFMVTRVDEDKFGGEAKGWATRAVAGLEARRTSRGRSVRFTAYLSFLSNIHHCSQGVPRVYLTLSHLLPKQGAGSPCPTVDKGTACP